MNDIERLKADILLAFPEAIAKLDRPLNEEGVWFLDVRVGSKHRVIMWQQDKGFGLCSCDDHGYGEGADEVYPSLMTVIGRVVELLQ